LRTYQALVDNYRKAGRYARVKQLFTEVRGTHLVPDEVMYNSAISACYESALRCEGIAWKFALGFFHEMQAEQMSPETEHYSSLITACEKSSQWELALSIPCEMQRRGVNFNVITFTTLMQANLRGDRWEAAVHLFDALSINNDEPNLITYTTVIAAFRAAKRWDLAMRLKIDMEQRGLLPYFTTYLYLIQTCAEAQQWGWVCFNLEEMHARRVDFVHWSHEAVLDAIMGNCPTPEARQRLQELVDDHFSSSFVPTDAQVISSWVRSAIGVE